MKITSIERLKLNLKTIGQTFQLYWTKTKPKNRRLFLSGLTVCGLLLFYNQIWSPLDEKRDTLRQAIKQSKKTATAMSILDQELRSFEKKKSHFTLETKMQKFNLIHEAIKESPFSNKLTLFKQNKNHELHVVFSPVDFDSFTAWLVTFSTAENLSVTQASIQNLNNQGQARVELIWVLYE